MLAHRVEGEHPTGYSNLLQKLEIQAEVRDPLLLKTTTARGSNITHSQIPENLFPSQKLKGSHTFTAQFTTVESNKAEEYLGMKPEEEEETESSAGECTETLSGVGGVISQLSILSVLPMQSSYIRGKFKIVLDAVALNIS